MNWPLILLDLIARGFEPWFFYVSGLSLFLLFLFGFSPIQETLESEVVEIAAIKIRRTLLGILVTLFLFLPLLVALLSVLVAGTKWFELFNSFIFDFWPAIKRFWSAPLAGLLAGVFFRVFYVRYFLPFRSRFFRRIRLKQTGESLSDIRNEKDRVKTKFFSPEKFYKKDRIFYGLNEKNQPVYVAVEDWKEQNQKIIGPTQTGKGVHIGVQLDQSIRKNFCTVFVDPKEDQHAVHIMHKACQDTGQKLWFLDLTDEEPKLFWHPFKNGAKREKRSRLHYAYGLKDTGLDSDFYKAGERELIDELWPRWDGTIKGLKNMLSSGKNVDSAKRTLSYLGEWQHIPSFNQGKTEFILDDFIASGGALYVKSSLQDETVIKGTTVFIMDLMQSIMRLYKENRRKNHVFIVVDEVKFLISDMLSESLATICGFDAHIAIAYQSVLDIRNLKDKSVNALAIEQSVNVNCKQTICYMAPDTETAEWASNQTGEIQKSVTRMEGVETNKLGGEEWEKRRLVKREAENYIPMNVFRVLPKRTGVFFQPGELAQILFTCWVPVTEKFRPQNDENIVYQEPQIKEDLVAPENEPETKQKDGKKTALEDFEVI